MDFIEKVSGVVTAKSQAAAEKAKEMAEIAKLKSKIASCEEVIKKSYAEIGRIVYEEYMEEAAAGADFDSECEADDTQQEKAYEKQITAINNAKKGIEEMQQQIKAIKGV